MPPVSIVISIARGYWSDKTEVFLLLTFSFIYCVNAVEHQFSAAIKLNIGRWKKDYVRLYLLLYGLLGMRDSLELLLLLPLATASLLHEVLVLLGLGQLSREVLVDGRLYALAAQLVAGVGRRHAAAGGDQGVARGVGALGNLLGRLVHQGPLRCALVLVCHLHGPFEEAIVLLHESHVAWRVNQLEPSAIVLLILLPFFIFSLLELLPFFESQPLLAFKSPLLKLYSLFSFEFLLFSNR